MRKIKDGFDLRYAEQWQMIRVEEMRKLIVTPERAAWIQRAYPFQDVGRPGILVVSNWIIKDGIKEFD